MKPIDSAVRIGLTFAAILLVVARPGLGETPLDRYGGIQGVVGKPGASFHLEKIGSRWWLVTPEGHGMFVRAVSKVDTSDYGGSGGFQSYDGVYVQSAAGAMSNNLAVAAENSHARDVLLPSGEVTLQGKGDSIYLGCSQWKPNFTYFWLDQLGKQGEVRWHYSTASGWKPIANAGRPHRGAAVAADGGWHFDCGDYMAPDASGLGAWGCARANRIVWWDLAQGFPADFAAVPLPGDPVPRYYLRGVVERQFEVAPIVNQIYERADLDEGIARKYGPGDYRGKWAAAMTRRLKSWGFNAAGQYSYQYVAKAAAPERFPVEPTWALGGWATAKNRPYRVKNVYAGAVLPPGSGNLLYQGLQPDVFDPKFERAYVDLVAEQAASKTPWSWALIPEEADYLFGLNSLTHDHMGYVVLSQNPYQPKARRDGDEIVYEDPRLHAKYALRDFLHDRYQGSIPRLNAAWGTRYTTWDTSAGDLHKGTHAWGSGSGLLDENGKGVLAEKVRSVGFDKSFTRPSHPAIRKDLDDFVGHFAARYGEVLGKAFAKVDHPVLLLPLYNGPDCVYRGVAPFVDGFWVSVPDSKDALRIYHAGRKPLVVADYLAADQDSPWYFKARIESVRYDPAARTTWIDAPDLRYIFRTAQLVTFPDCRELIEKGTCGGKYVYAYPRIKSARWSRLEVPGDFSGGVNPGMHVEMWKYEKNAYAFPKQEDRGRAMADRYRELIDLRGDDGTQFVVGVEHWCLYDPAVSNGGDNRNFGLATLQDNAYDGVEARRAVKTDSAGLPIGGEAADYGDLLGPLGKFLRGVDSQLRAL